MLDVLLDVLLVAALALLPYAALDVAARLFGIVPGKRIGDDHGG
jgi:hypothetical protein